MKKTSVIIVAIVILLGAMAYFFTKQNSQPEVVVPEVSVTEENTTAEKIWYTCADNTRISVLYSEDREQVTLAFHDMLYNLAKDTSSSDTVYIDPVTKVTITELQGGITVSQPSEDLTIACLPTE